MLLRVADQHIIWAKFAQKKAPNRSSTQIRGDKRVLAERPVCNAVDIARYEANVFELARV